MDMVSQIEEASLVDQANDDTRAFTELYNSYSTRA